MAIGFKTIITKTIGAGSLGLGIYDAHCRAKRESIRYGKVAMADSAMDAWMNTTRLEVESDIEAGMRKGAQEWMMDSPIPKAFGNLKGYVTGFFSSVADNVIPITLSAGVLMSKAGGLFSKLSLGGLGGYAIYKTVRAFLPTARSRKTP